MIFRLSLCLINRHAPKRHRVKWDGLHFVGTCRHCHKAIRRQDQGGWRADWMASEPAMPPAKPNAPLSE